MRILLILIFLSCGMFVFADEKPEKTAKAAEYYADKLDYSNYLQDPSQYIYDSTQEQYIYDNYGSSASMDYLNRADANSYSGGSDFDRNY